MLTKLTVAGLGIAAAVILAPTASADSSDLTNADVHPAKPLSLVEQFVYCFNHNDTSKIKMDNGLSSSSQSVLDRINHPN